MSLLTAHNHRTTKSAHQIRIAAGLVSLPIALLAAAAYGPIALQAIGSGLGLALTLAAIVGVIVTAVFLAIRDRGAEQDHDVYDVR